jgi:hypothetical protein
MIHGGAGHRSSQGDGSHVQWQKDIASELGVNSNQSWRRSARRRRRSSRRLWRMMSPSRRSPSAPATAVTAWLGSHFEIALFPLKPRARNCRPHESKRAPRKDKTAMREHRPDSVIIPPHKYDLKRLPHAKRLVELRPGECMWPINDGSPFLFCAAKAAGKYCQHHQSRALTSQQNKKQR